MKTISHLCKTAFFIFVFLTGLTNHLRAACKPTVTSNSYFFKPFEGVGYDISDGCIASQLHVYAELTSNYWPEQYKYLELPSSLKGTFKLDNNAPGHVFSETYFTTLYVEGKTAGGDSVLQILDVSPEGYVNVNLESNITGIDLTINNKWGAQRSKPIRDPFLAGSKITLSAPLTQTILGKTYQFVGWSDGGGPTHEVTLPESAITPSGAYFLDVSYRAEYVLISVPTTYTLTVLNGSGGGSYQPGTVVNIVADPPSAGQMFDRWVGATVANTFSPMTTLIMPGANTTLAAAYKQIPVSVTLTVTNGSGSGSYAPGTIVTITANAAPAGYTFDKWIGAPVANENSPNTTLIIPTSNATVTASYKVIPLPTFKLTVKQGLGSGSYTAGTVVTITANPPAEEKVFDRWVGAPVTNPNSPATTLIMPSANTILTATYKPLTPPLFTLTVKNGFGSGQYAMGTVVSISANPAPLGQTFDKWVGAAAVTDNKSPTTTLTMPALSFIMTATYKFLPQPVNLIGVIEKPRNQIDIAAASPEANSSPAEEGFLPFQNVVNPFVQSMNILYKTNKNQDVDLHIIDMQGHHIRHLQDEGGHATWDCRNDEGSLVASGVYLVIYNNAKQKVVVLK